MEERLEMVMEEENMFDKLIGLKAEVNQMEAMIAENIRLIAEGDDVEGREFLKSHLEMEVKKKKAEIKKIEASIAEEEV
jgi:hypothetical protein